MPLNLSNHKIYLIALYNIIALLGIASVWFCSKAYSIVPLVDGWPLLHRIMEFNEGRISLASYLFSPHGAHLHFLIYAAGLIDYRIFGGAQSFQFVLSMISVAGLALFYTRFFANLAAPNRYVLPMLSAIMAAALLLSPADEETLLLPFQFVLSGSRFAYIVLLYAYSHYIAAPGRKYFYALIVLSMGAACFHGSGHLFGLTILILAVLSRLPWRRIVLSALPLLSSLTAQIVFSAGQSELGMIGKILRPQVIPELFLSLCAFFAAPFRVLEPLTGVGLLLGLGGIIFLFVSFNAALSTFRVYMTCRQKTASFDGDRLFILSTEILVLLSALGAAIFWLVRSDINIIDGIQPHLQVIHTSRYACLASLAYIACAYHLIYTRYKISQYASVMVIVVILGGFFWQAIYTMRHYSTGQALNSAGAGLLSNSGPFAKETQFIWQGADQDWYWKNELPKTIAYLKQHRRGIWWQMPAMGDRLSAASVGYAVKGKVKEPIGQDLCVVTGLVSRWADAEDSRIMPMVDSNNVVVGYASLAGPQIKGYLACNSAEPVWIMPID